MSANLDNSTPAAPAGNTNITWQFDGAGNISGYVPNAAPNPVPLSVSGCKIWVDASQLSGYVDGDTVYQWNNLAPGGKDVYCKIGTNIPVYKTGILNSLPIVRFDGTGWYQWLEQDGGLGGESYFIVFKISSLANAYTGLFGNSFDAAHFYQFFVKSNGKTAFYNQTASYDGTGSQTMGTVNFQVLSMVAGPYKGISTRVALTADFTDTSTTGFVFSVPQGFPNMGSLGNDLQFGSRVFTGDIAEFIVYDQALNAADTNTVENYLKTKWGL